MTSILTNMAAMAALQTLRTIGANIADTQRQVSSGLRVQTAADNAAYWSISTTMRSDNMALSAVSDALGLGAAKVDVAYAGMESTIDVLSQFRTKLVAAKEDGLDKGKIQTELDQLKDQLLSIATSASFNGVNWLNTNAPENLWELSSLPTGITSSFIRSADGSVRVGTTDIDLADLSLFNVGGGGALQKDPRALGEIAGFRNASLNAHSAAGGQGFAMTGSVTLGVADTISFEILIDGSASHTVTFSKNTIDTALGTTDGVINNINDYADVLNQAFSEAGISSLVKADRNVFGPPFQPGLDLASLENTGANASTIAVSAVSDSTGNDAGGLMGTPISDRPGAYATDQLTFTSPFRVYRDVAFSFDFSVNSNPAQTVTVDRDLVDATLGTSDGMVNSATDLAAVLNAAVSSQGLIVSEASGNVVFDVDPAVYPQMGYRSSLVVSNVTDNIGPAPDFDILDVDITDPANSLDNYLSGVDAMLQKVISGGSAVGAVKTRIDIQQDFAQTLIDSIDRGIGRLIDADMNEASTRLKALQTQEQLAIQSLQIANSNAENILQLFR
ncbi:flagellin [Agrobacterium tumefaciens]|uniref:Flagellin n=1 Tax=Agrobacterium leguminum TaxID=2792015 RepID=A0A9X3KI55_9HYPH|nr:MULTISPECIES: flagellin [Agrobacterium]MCZ7912312.1 flagellin [Agrobacterium leguminum]WQE39115.1 flagellin [Agrobacterium tumefaciens]